MAIYSLFLFLHIETAEATTNDGCPNEAAPIGTAVVNANEAAATIDANGRHGRLVPRGYDWSNQNKRWPLHRRQFCSTGKS